MNILDAVLRSLEYEFAVDPLYPFNPVSFLPSIGSAGVTVLCGTSIFKNCGIPTFSIVVFLQPSPCVHSVMLR